LFAVGKKLFTYTCVYRGRGVKNEVLQTASGVNLSLL